MSALPLEEQVELVAATALDAILEGLDAANISRPERVVYLVPGDAIVWDEIDGCKGGQLTARLATLVPHRSGAKTASLTPCSIDYWTATIEITLLRCAVVVSNTGKAPTAERLTADGVKGVTDLAVMLRAITTMEEVDDVTSWVPQGPQGGVFGNQWSFTTKLDSTPC